MCLCVYVNIMVWYHTFEHRKFQERQIVITIDLRLNYELLIQLAETSVVLSNMWYQYRYMVDIVRTQGHLVRSIQHDL